MSNDARALIAELREMFSGPVLREIAGVRDQGEVLLGTIGFENGEEVDVADDNRDAHASATESLGEHHLKGRLYTPAGILFRKPKKGETAHFLRAKDHEGPGSMLAIPDGGDAEKDHLPDWYADKVGLYAKEPIRIEAKDQPVEIVVGEAVITVATDGSISITAKAGKKVSVNGTDFALPKWDNFLAGLVTPTAPGTPYHSLADILAAILNALTTPCANGVPLIAPGTPALFNFIDFIVRVAGTEYKSDKATNG